MLCLTHSSIYTHLNTLKKKTIGKHCGKKGEIAQHEQFHLFLHNVFYSVCILKSTLQWSSAASLNLGWLKKVHQGMG